MKLKLWWRPATGGDDKTLEGTVEFPQVAFDTMMNTESFQAAMDDWEMGVGGSGCMDIFGEGDFIGFDMTEYDEKDDLMPGKIPQEIMADLERMMENVLKELTAEEKDSSGEIVMIYLSETDGDIVTKQLKRESVRENIKKNSLHENDYALIEGKLVKGFDDKELEEFTPIEET